MKYIALALALAAASVSAETSTEMCSGFCNREWSDFLDDCNGACDAAAQGGLDCTADASASREEKYAFWSACSYGSGLGKGSSCDQFCARLHFDHHFSKFFELGCKHVCRAAISHHKDNHPIECRKHLCSTLRVEMCWRGCNYAAGFVDGTDHTCSDC